MRLTIVAAALAALSLSSALSPAAAAINELGIDISLAGNTHAEVQAYLATLNPDTRKAVLDGCRHSLQQPVQADASTINFCKLAL
jgi:hypothetical protein